jgi:class 3 adenylate cyclase/putative methionine-R-sulfoxide reductase with GAF domain
MRRQKQGRTAPKSTPRSVRSHASVADRELREARAQQAATAEILRVIHTSPTDLQSVFETIVRNAVSLCRSLFANVFRFDGTLLHFIASHNVGPSYVDLLQEKYPMCPDLSQVSGRVIFTKSVVRIEDVLTDPNYDQRFPRRMGWRRMLGIPMLREDDPIGVIVVGWGEAGPIVEDQEDLLNTFAAQAVIAIENTRLLNELRQCTDDLTESLEQQTATSEVLKVISRSPGDLEPVFNAMLANATRICEAKLGTLFLRQDHCYSAVVVHGDSYYADWYRRDPVIDMTKSANLGTPLQRLLVDKSVIHIVDLRQDEAYLGGNPRMKALVESAGARTHLVVPMLKDTELIGAIIIYRQEVRPFSEKHIELVKNFAAQAVIAIENTRLLNELRDRTTDLEQSYRTVSEQAAQLEQQSQQLFTMNQQLESRVAEQVGEIERMGRLRRFLPPQVADLVVASGTENQLESHRREITALFCDLRGFTGFSETSDPEDVMALLCDYHAAIGEIIIQYSGTLERYAGDGVMVIFNDPVPVSNPALQAVKMALDMRVAIGGLIEKWRRLGHDLGFGIGIAHGFATLGTIGFEGRFDYAAIGTVSNVASRLCDEAKPGQILISPRVLMAVENDVSVEPVGEFTLKGIHRPMAACNVLAIKSTD